MEILFKSNERKNITVVYEDEAILIVYKPRYMHTLKQSHSEDSLELFLEQLPLNLSVLPESGLIQRLDFVTAGLVLVAKNVDSYHYLRQESRDFRMEKEYQAISSLATASFVPTGFSAHAWDTRRMQEGWFVDIASRFVYRGKGREAVRLLPIESRSKHASDSYYSHVMLDKIEPEARYHFRVRLHKGYRHQVRATLSALGFPIFGDTLYGGVAQDIVAFGRQP